MDPLPGNIQGVDNFWTKWRTTYFADKEGSPELALFPDRGQMLRTIYVAHPVIKQAVLDFWGSVFVVLDAPRNVRWLSRINPHSAAPDWPTMWVQSISNVLPLALRPNLANADELFLLGLSDVQGRDANNWPTYKTAEMQLQYVMPTFKIKSDLAVTNIIKDDLFFGFPDEGQALKDGYATSSRYITRIPKNASKMLTIPRGILQDSIGRTVMEAIAISEHYAEYIYTWHQVPENALPELTWIAGANTVNDDVFDGRPAGTLLFSGEPDVRLSPNPMTGQILYDVTYKFHSYILMDDSVNPPIPRGHNWIRRLSVDRTRLVPQMFSADGIGTAPGTRIFRNFDFRRLFRPDQPP